MSGLGCYRKIMNSNHTSGTETQDSVLAKILFINKNSIKLLRLSHRYDNRNVSEVFRPQCGPDFKKLMYPASFPSFIIRKVREYNTIISLALLAV